jgi:tetratricopeptide (TPR) repeat protein/transcriptional regulator with XRE-family HTH domain
MGEARSVNHPDPPGRRSNQTTTQRFGHEILDLCEKRGWSVRELARRTYLDVGLISKASRGITLPSQEAVRRLDLTLEAGGSLVDLADAARAEPLLHLTSARLFVGRHAQLVRLAAVARAMTAASPPTAILVTGPPGVGKTALAAHWAGDAGSAFDTVLWADLRGYTGRRGDEAAPVDILEDLLRGLGVPATHIPVTEQERRRSLAGQLLKKPRRVLIVLDNARDLAQVKPVLPRTPGTTVLITSRRKIIGLAQEARVTHVPLAAMDEDDGARLVASVIGEDRAGREPAAVARLVSLCASLPLALNIAANLVAADPGTSVREHADALAERGRLHLLDGDDSAVGVRSAFSWSYDAASPPDARMFRLLGLHPGPSFSAGAAAALAGIGEHEATLLLDHLTHAHLVQRVDGRFYRLHDLLRAYAAEEAAAPAWDADRVPAVTRLVRWYVHGANAASWALTPTRDHHVDLGPPPPGVGPPSFDSAQAALSWCAAEMPNVTPVTQLALDHELWFEAWRLPTDLIDYHVMGRLWKAWTTSTELALRAARSAGNDIWAAEAADKLSEVYRRQRDYDRADELDHLAFALLEPLAPHPRLGWALVGLGNTAHARGRFTEAAELISQGVRAFVAAGSRIGEATARMHRGRALRSVDDREGALREGQLALAMFREDGDLHGIASSLVPLARTLHAFGELPEALDRCDQGVAAYRDASDPWGEADALGVKGLVLNDLGRRDDALRCLTEAVHLVETLDENKAQRLRNAILAVAGDGG